MDLERLPALKERLLHEKDLGRVMACFFDWFGDDPEFVTMGERIRHPLLKIILKRIGGQILGRSVEHCELMLVRLQEHRFVHGLALLNGHPAAVFYFEDVQVGLVAMIDVRNFPRPPEARLTRFTARLMPPGWEPESS